MRRFAFASQKYAESPRFAGSLRAQAPFAGGGLPLSRAKRSQRLLWRLAMALFTGFGLVGALALREADFSVSPNISVPPQSAPLPAWLETPTVMELFKLEAPEFAKQPKTYEVRRHRMGGGRQDILVQGSLNGSSPYLRLMVYRIGDEAAPDAAFFVDLARRAAEIGRGITYAAQPTALQTRFGVFEVAELNLTRGETGDVACLGFRFADAALKLRIAGFTCGAEVKLAAASPAKLWLTCLLDRIDLASAAQDKNLIAFFAARELSDVTACTKAGPRQRG
jgi:hypothetical protein